MQRAQFLLAVALLVPASGCHESHNPAGASSAEVSPSQMQAKDPLGARYTSRRHRYAHVPLPLESGPRAQCCSPGSGLSSEDHYISPAQMYFDQGLRFVWLSITTKRRAASQEPPRLIRGAPCASGVVIDCGPQLQPAIHGRGAGEGSLGGARKGPRCRAAGLAG